MKFKVKVNTTSEEVCKMYHELNEEMFKDNLLPICIQVFPGANKYPTKNGLYLVVSHWDEENQEYLSDTVYKYMTITELRRYKLQRILKCYI